MTIWQDNLLDPIYASDIAVDAQLIRTTGEQHTLRAIDNTAGISMPGASIIEMQTLRPAANVRHKEVVELGITDLKEYFYKGELVINGKRWRIKSFQMQPAPSGFGEILLLLADEQAQ